jgi:hypothetical protein
VHRLCARGAAVAVTHSSDGKPTRGGPHPNPELAGQKVGQAAVIRRWVFEDGREGGPDSGAAAAEEAGPPSAADVAAAEEAVAEQARPLLARGCSPARSAVQRRGCSGGGAAEGAENAYGPPSKAGAAVDQCAWLGSALVDTVSARVDCFW